jgi:hypothetical protein
MGVELLSNFIRENYDVHEWRHACAILHNDFPDEFKDITDLLEQFKFYKKWINIGGGSKSKVSGAMDSFLGKKGWKETKFATSIKVDETIRETPTHKVDCYKNRVALEIEWNNKDPFFDRDLNNFRLLFELQAISIGVIITRCDELQVIFDNLGRGSSYGNSTTHISKLLPRIEGGGGGGCPILIFGIKDKLYVEDC